MCGLSGRTAEELLERADAEAIRDVGYRKGAGLRHLLKAHGPFDLVLIMLGTNDISMGAAPEIVFEDIRRLHALCHERGTPTMALSMPPTEFLYTEPVSQAYRDCWDQVNGLLREWATSPSRLEDCGCQPLFADTAELVPWFQEGSYESDGLHFSPAGSRRLGEGLAPLLLPALRPPLPPP